MAAGYIIKDAAALYIASQSCFTVLLDRYFQMTKEQAQQGLEAYKLFGGSVPDLQRLFELSASLPKEQKIPRLKEFPPELISQMESYIKEPEDPLAAMSKEEIEEQKKLMKEFELKKKQQEKEQIEAYNALQLYESDEEKQENPKR